MLFRWACKKSFLDQTNTFGISPDAAASKPQQVISLVNAIYDTYQNSDLLKKCIWYRANFGTHDFFNWGADVFWNNYQIPRQFSSGLLLSGTNLILVLQGQILHLELFQKQKNTGVIDPALANRLRGEAFFLRGMTYYYLAASFGGVPLETDTTGAINLGLRPRAFEGFCVYAGSVRYAAGRKFAIVKNTASSMLIWEGQRRELPMPMRVLHACG